MIIIAIKGITTINAAFSRESVSDGEGGYSTVKCFRFEFRTNLYPIQLYLPGHK